MTTRAEHWAEVWSTREPTEVSWYEHDAQRSLALIELLCPDRDAGIIDAGGGASPLVDDLLEVGYRNVSVLDISREALDIAADRLGPLATSVTWLCQDVLEGLDGRQFDVWHDRAVLHFLRRPEDREAYAAHAAGAVVHGGHLIVSSFAPDGPTHCSGLEIERASAGDLADLFAPSFELVGNDRLTHVTPRGESQRFVRAWLRRSAVD